MTSVGSGDEGVSISKIRKLSLTTLGPRITRFESCQVMSVTQSTKNLYAVWPYMKEEWLCAPLNRWLKRGPRHVRPGCKRGSFEDSHWNR